MCIVERPVAFLKVRTSILPWISSRISWALKEILNNPFMVTTVCGLINVAIKSLKKRGLTCEDIEARLKRDARRDKG